MRITWFALIVALSIVLGGFIQASFAALQQEIAANKLSSPIMSTPPSDNECEDIRDLIGKRNLDQDTKDRKQALFDCEGGVGNGEATRGF